MMQVAACTVVLSGAFMLAGQSLAGAAVLGMGLALSSTAVVIKMLESSGDLDKPVGRTVIGILIAQDMAVVPMMLFLGGLERKGIMPLDLIKVVFSVVFLVVLFWLLLRQKLRRGIKNGGHAGGVLCRQGGNGAHGKHAVGGHGLDIGLNSGAAAGITAGNGQCSFHG
jgi:Kef-type K+ transport system membrane component KefB